MPKIYILFFILAAGAGAATSYFYLEAQASTAPSSLETTTTNSKKIRQISSEPEIQHRDSGTHDHDHDHDHDYSDSNFDQHELTPEKLLCIDEMDHHSCNIDINVNLSELLIDKKLNVTKADEAGIILGSKNYKEVMKSISGLSSENIMKSEEFNQMAKSISADLNINVESNFSCNETLCAAESRVESDEEWQIFTANFFEGEAGGNLFLSYDPTDPNLRRSIVIFGDNMSVIRKVK
ncbi:hypothetical protein [Microbulbifer sp. VVAC002]|uniref:hypothetical protein n=1 Tax=Microbulbifer sp. VVAC002 TaxID=3243387 RepID=UPI00403A196F